MSIEQTITKFTAALNKPAKFTVEGEEDLVGYITSVWVHLVDGEPCVFIGGNDKNVEGIVRDYFNPSEVTIL